MSKENEKLNNTDEVEEVSDKSDKFRRLKRGGFSVALTVIFIAAVVLINVIVSTLLSRFDFRLDLTEHGIYSIEQSTEDYLSALDDTINFYFCSSEESFKNRSFAYAQVTEIAERFVEANPRFTLTYKDRLADPAFSVKYGGNLNDSDIVIESENTGRYRVLHSAEYLVYEFFVGGQPVSEQDAMLYEQLGYMPDIIVSGSNAEQAFLSAVMAVSDTAPVTVAFSEGFGEGGASGTAYGGMEDLLYKNSYIIEKVNMMNAEEISPEIDFLIIHTPMYDYTVGAINKLETWLDNGGMYGKTLLYFPIIGYEIRPTPNLDAFLEEWGVSVADGYARQLNTRFSTSDGYEQFIHAGEEFSEGIEEGSLVGAFMRPLNLLFEAATGYTTGSLLTTFDGTVLIPFDVFGQADEETLSAPPEMFDVGVISRKQRYESVEQLTSSLIVIGSPEIFNRYFLETDRFSNAKFLLNMFADISGRDETDFADIMIIPKSFRMTGFEITARQANTIALVFVIILPAVIIAAGLIVFFRRRYK